MADPRVKRGVGATLTTLKRRPEFLRVRAGARWAMPAFVLEAKRRADAGHNENVPRFGFTVSKQIGGAVDRNRVRRRLKAAVCGILPEHARRDFDYVVIARRPALDAAFDGLVADLVEALGRVHRHGERKRPERDGKRRGRGIERRTQ
jgi:ribonuclease P protein component